MRTSSPSADKGGKGPQKRPRFANFLSQGRTGCPGVSSAEITALLKAWSSGDEAALARLAEQVYPELHLMAVPVISFEGKKIDYGLGLDKSVA